MAEPVGAGTARQRPEVGIVGTGNWGTTIGLLQARAGRRVLLCSRDAGRAERLEEERENRASLPGYPFPPGLEVAAGYAAAALAPIVILAVPSEHLRAACQALRPALGSGHLLVSATKGLEAGTGARVSEVAADELPAHPLAVLSGPNLAGEIASGMPAAAVLAGAGAAWTAALAHALSTRLFRIYTSDDVIGVELGGSLKNVVAVAAGICDGLGIGLNGKAAIVTRGMAEIARLGVACGANPLTFAGLSGYGDLFATCVSRSSRNHHVGEQIGLGRPLAEVLAGMTMVAEGVSTAPAARLLAVRHGVEMPITDQVCAVLFEGKDPRAATGDLLDRHAGSELAGPLL